MIRLECPAFPKYHMSAIKTSLLMFLPLKHVKTTSIAILAFKRQKWQKFAFFKFHWPQGNENSVLTAVWIRFLMALILMAFHSRERSSKFKVLPTNIDNSLNVVQPDLRLHKCLHIDTKTLGFPLPRFTHCLSKRRPNCEPTQFLAKNRIELSEITANPFS